MQDVFAHSRLIVIVIAIGTLLFAFRTSRTPINGDPLHAFVDDQQLIEIHLSQSKKFGDDSGKILVVAVDDGKHLFKASHLDAIREAKNEILAIKEVQSVTTIVDAYRSRDPRQRRNIKTVARESLARRQLSDGLVPEIDFRPSRYWELSPQLRTRSSPAKFKRDALKDDRLVGKLLSADGTKHSIVVVIDPDIELSIPRQQSLWDDVRKILIDHGVGKNEIFVAGLPFINAAISLEIQNAFLRFLPIGFIAVAILVFLIYRDFRVTGLILLIGIIAVIWSLGITSFVFGEITIIVAAAPLVILAVSTTDFLHITTAYQIALDDNHIDKEVVLSDVLCEVGGACVLTSITTFVGFASLVLTHSVAVRHFGFACAVGTSIALLLMVTLLPIAYRSMKPLTGSTSSNWVYRVIDRGIDLCHSVVDRIPKAIFLFTIAICLPGMWVISGKSIDADLPSRFPAGHPIRNSMEVLENEFAGANSIDLYVTGSAELLLASSFNHSLRRFASKLESEQDVLGTISILDIYKGIEDSISYRTSDRLPPSQQSANASLEWVAKIEPDFVDSLITPERDEVRFRIMVRSAGFRHTNRLAERLRETLQNELGSSYQVSAGGTYSIIGGSVTGIVRSQIFGFFICVVSLTVILMWGLGSWRVGMLAQIPNLIPVLLMVAVVAFSLNRIDSDLLGLPMIALGIAVDDTIHFMNRFRLELARGRDTDAAIRSVFKTTGRSIVISTLALCMGLVPLAFAQIISLWMIGTFLVVGILGALVADLLCLPAMIKLGLIKYTVNPDDMQRKD